LSFCFAILPEAVKSSYVLQRSTVAFPFNDFRFVSDIGIADSLFLVSFFLFDLLFACFE